MHLCHRNNHSEYLLGILYLESVNEEKDLGIYITDNLKPTVSKNIPKQAEHLANW